MTTEQQAREALDALDDYARMANIAAVGPLKVLTDFITQAAEDKRIADAVRGGQLGFQCLETERVAICEHHDPVPTLGFRNVLIFPADAVGGE